MINMYFKIENEIFNANNFQYYEYTDNILSLYFNGTVAIKIKQNQFEFENFLELLEVDKNNILFENLGINTNNISGISKNEDNILIYFVDGSAKQINLKFSEIENKLLGE